MGLTLAAMAYRKGYEVQIREAGPADLTASCGWWAGGMLAPFCEGEHAPHLVMRLGLRSLALWPYLLAPQEVAIQTPPEDVPTSSGRNMAPQVNRHLFARTGTLVVAHERDWNDLARFCDLTQGWRSLDEAGIATMEPALTGRFRAGLYYEEEACLDPRGVLNFLKETLLAQGVPIRFGDRVTNSEKIPGLVVDCRGMGSKHILPNLRGIKGEMMLVRTQALQLRRPIRLLHPRRHPLYIVPRQEGVFMVGATTIESEDRSGPSVRSLGELATQLYHLHPAFSEAEILEINAGLRPALPDHRPQIFANNQKLRVNGLYRHGFLMAPALAEAVLIYLEGGKIDDELLTTES